MFAICLENYANRCRRPRGHSSICTCLSWETWWTPCSRECRL